MLHRTSVEGIAILQGIKWEINVEQKRGGIILVSRAMEVTSRVFISIRVSSWTCKI